MRDGGPPPGPPRALEGLVRLLLGRGEDARFILGDLREEHARHPSAWRYAARGVRVAVRLRAARATRRIRGRGRAGTTMRTVTGGEGTMRSILGDVRIGVRGFARRPGLTLAVVATLGLAVGATTTVVSAVRGVLLAPLPYDAPERLTVVEVNTGGAGWYGASGPEYLDMARELRSLEGVSGFVAGQLVLGDSAAPRRTAVVFATSGLLPLLGVDPLLGRPFTPEEDGPGAEPVVVLSHGLWRERFGGDRAALGATLPMSGSDYRVVGVMPPGFAFPDDRAEAWVPLGLDPSDPPPRANHFLTVVARRAPGVTPETAAAELERFAEATRGRFPENYSGRGFRVRVSDMHRWVVGPTRTPLLVLLGTVALVLFIACANVANLLLVRSEGRAPEMAVRTALGAGRGRLIRQLLTESLLLAAAGGAAGVALAVFGVETLLALAPPDTPRLSGVALDGPTLGWAALLTGVTGILFGLVPALRVGRGGGGAALSGVRGTPGSGRGSARTRRALLGLQVALAAVLTVGAGLMVRTLGALYGTELGFRPEGLLTLELNPPGSAYPGAQERVAFYRTLRERVAAVPGVEGVATTCQLPMTGRCGYLSLILEGQEGASVGDAPDAVREIVSPSYAEVLGVRTLRGRWLGEGDGPEAPLVAVVNETMADELWPGREPLGERFRMWSEGWPWMEVVGVVADVRNRGVGEPPEPTFYVTAGQASRAAYAMPLGAGLAVRTAGDPLDVVAGVREAIRDVDARAAVSRVRPMTAVVGSTVAIRRFTLRLLQAFAFVALFLAGVGVYGVMSVSVGERRAEIGLRKALGAATGGLVGPVLGQELLLAAAGAAVGLTGGVLLARSMETLLWGVSALDVPTLVASFAVLLAVAAGGALLPAWRASRVDPVSALREGR